MTTNRNHTEMTEPAQSPSHLQDDKNADASSESSPGKATADPQALAMANAEWCLIVVEDGEYPKLELFPDLAGLKARLRELDEQGGTVNAFPFYGVPIAFTPGPFRFLYLPDGQIEPLFDFEPYGRFVAHPGAKPPIDRRFYLGPADADVPEAIVDHRQPAEAPRATRKRQQERKDLPAEPSAAPVEVGGSPLEPCMAAVATV